MKFNVKFNAKKLTSQTRKQRFETSPSSDSPLSTQRNELSRARWLLFFAVIAFAASLGILRFALMVYLNLPLQLAWSLGLGTGLMGDLAMAFFVMGLAVLVQGALTSVAGLNVARRARNSALFIVAFAIWLATFSNFSNFKFFRIPLALWSVATNGRNLWSLRGIIEKLLSDSWTVASLGLLTASFLLAFASRRASRLARVEDRGLRGRSFLSAYAGAIGVMAIVIGLLVRQSPQWFRWPILSESIVCDSVLVRWFDLYQKIGQAAFHHARDYSDIAPEAEHWLTTFSHSDGENWQDLTLNKNNVRSHGVLMRRFEPDPQHVEKLRADLGLATSKPNVIVLFLEGARSFEYLHPELGPVLYPRLHKLLNKHAIYFPEAYSSATMTVAGQYSVLCSEFCSMEGPPVYQASPNLDVKCLQSVFADNGYRTMWMNPFHRFFAGKYVFEVSHGMREFYDRDDFKPRDDAEKSRAGEWGIDDRAFLDQALKKLVAANAAGRPFFAHLLTTGTHAPWNRPYSENTVSAELLEKTQANHDYQGYIKAVTLLDAALDDFFAKLFASPIGDNTVVMLVSDHGLTVEPSYPHVTVVQRSQLLSRIMFAVVSKNTARPRVDHVPVHQIDIAPLLATIAEVKADTSWLGRDPTLGSGTPYVVEYGSRLQYRTRDRYCAQLPEVDRVACWAASAVNDPLIALAVPEVAADQQITDNFRNVVRANEALIASGSMMGSHVECRECPLRRDRR